MVASGHWLAGMTNASSESSGISCGVYRSQDQDRDATFYVSSLTAAFPGTFSSFSSRTTSHTLAGFDLSVFKDLEDSERKDGVETCFRLYISFFGQSAAFIQNKTVSTIIIQNTIIYLQETINYIIAYL